MYGKKDEDNDGQPFGKIERAAVLQDTRLFTQTSIQARKSCIVLTKILYLIYQGHVFSVKEATDVFFAMTRLFQSKDASLRRLVYLAIKELSYADHVLMVTSSLTKDITGKEVNYKSAAIRALCCITDSSNVQGIERYIKQAIVDRNPSVASSALVSALHLYDENADVVKRWVNEVQEAVNSRSVMVQYHALGLLYKIKQRDRLAIMKLVGTSTRGSVSIRSSYAMIMLIRYVSKILQETEDPNDRRQFMEYLEHCLRDSSDMVMYEAARTICFLDNVSDRDLGMAVSVLQLFLANPLASIRFAAVKTLNQVAMKHPVAVASCNLDMEALISDPNKSIGVMAITTLLKTGSESTVDRLIQQIQPMMVGITDDFKMVVTRAIGELALKFPAQQHVMMNFLSGILRDQGGYDYKLSIVNTLIAITTQVPDAKESGLLHLCEFIEDCDYSSLCARVLRLLGEHCPTMPNPSRYIKYIHNRVILEDAEVRAAAVSALAKFGIRCEDLAPAVIVLLSRCKYDVDDEVRDRATFYVDLLRKDRVLANKLTSESLPFSIAGLERTLFNYVKNSNGSEKFDIKSVPLESNVNYRKQSQSQSRSRDTNTLDTSVSQKTTTTSIQEKHSSQLAEIPQFASFGSVFKSSKPVMLTENETEYVVRCIKHVFLHHIVFQFDITNTISEFELRNLIVSMTNEDDFETISVIPLDSLGYEEEKSTYVAARLPEDPFSVSGIFSCTLKFVCHEDESEDGYEDEYQIEELEVTTADHVLPISVPNFGSAWEDIGDGAEIVEVFELSSMKSLKEAVTTVTGHLGMYPCERTDVVEESKNSHTLLLAGFYRGHHKVLVRARLAFQMGSGVTMQLSVRSSDEDTAQVLVAAIG